MAKRKSLPIYCWDSSTFVAWLYEEASAPLSDIELVVAEVDSGKAYLIVPAPVYSELFMDSLDDKQRDLLDGFLNRSNVVSVDLTIVISKKASSIRERARREQPKRNLKNPDAQIVATAILHKANVLHSLDKGLLKLNGHSTVDGLSIHKPGLLSGQKGLL